MVKSRLCDLNDILEGYHSINNREDLYKGLSKYVYVSCWTNNEKESIPMWHIYTKMKGVKIKVKSNMFSDNFFVKEVSDSFIPYQNIEKLIFLIKTKKELIK